MNRILALVEGQTEETFVRDILESHLQGLDIYITPVVVSTKRVKSGFKFKGGITSYRQFKSDLQSLLGDRGAIAVTTMIDYYGLPQDFPGFRTLSATHSCYQRATHLENSLKDEITDPRLLPFVSLHEFEALILTSPDQIATVFTDPKVVAKFKAMVTDVDSPEEINDGRETHPSARMRRLLPGYRKRVHGPLIASRIGLERIRQACPHFSSWVSQLEKV